jgi:ribonuclease HI
MSILNYFKNNDELLTEKKKFHTNELLVSIGSFANEPNEPLVPIGINSLDDIDIYTDGACSNNGKKYAKAGIGIYISDNLKISERLKGLQTNQRAELYAILKALTIIDILKYKTINIYTDSMYSINCITKWIKNWKKNGWLDKKKKLVKNKDLVDNIDKIIIKYSHIKFNYIEAHTKKNDIHSLNNEKADKLAKKSLLEVLFP